MAFALVGAAGAAVQTSSGAALTTAAFGTNERRSAGNLLLFFVTVTGSATLPGTPSGWGIASQVAGTSCSATIYSRVATGADAAPTISAITSGVIAGHLEEWTGGTILDRATTATGTTSPVTATQAAANANANELVVLAAADRRSSANASNDTWTSNHGTPDLRASNNAVSSANHYSHATLISNSAASADTGIVTLSITTNITGIAVAMAAFRSGATVTPERAGPGKYAAAVLADSPIAYWRLGEPSGTNANDEIGTADGTYTNTPTLGVAGLVGGTDTAVSFTRASKHFVDIASNMPAGGASAVSVEAWIKLASMPTVGQSYDIFDWLPNPQTTGLFQLQLGYDGDRFLLWSFWDGTTFRSRGFPNDFPFTVGNTYHVVVTQNYSGQVITCYIDTLSSAIQQPTTTAVAPAAGVRTSIGKWWNSDTNPFDGTIDEVAVYSAVLSSTQVANHFAAARGLVLTFFAPVIASAIVGASPTALVLATFAPVIGRAIVGASPTALTLATFAPVIRTTIVGASPTTLSLSTFAPTVSATAHQIATPGLVALSLATFAPVVTASDHKTATPPTLTLTLATFAPVITASDHKVATPPLVALSLSTFAPTISTDDHKLVTPGVATLTLSTFAPAVTASDHKTAAPPVISLSLATLAPTVTASDHKLATPPTVALALSTFAPTVTASDPKLVTPGLVTLALSTFAPSAFVAVRVTPDALALILSGLAPTLVLPITVTPDALALTLETFEPISFVPDPVVVTLGLLELVISGLAPMPNIGHPMSPAFIAGVDMVPVATASVSVVESPAVTVAFDEQEVSVTWAT